MLNTVFPSPSGLREEGGRDIKKNGAKPPCWSGRGGRFRAIFRIALRNISAKAPTPSAPGFGGFAAFYTPVDQRKQGRVRERLRLTPDHG